jgi:hypothetical protein
MSTFLTLEKAARTERHIASNLNPVADPSNAWNLEPISLSDVVDPSAFRKECFRVFLNPLGGEESQGGTR